MATTAKDKKGLEELLKGKVMIGRAEDYRLVYADGVRITVGGYDIKLTLSTNEKMLDGATLITDQVTVVLSPQHAKDLAIKLSEQVAAFEKDIMPLNFTEKFTKQQERQQKMTEAIMNNEQK